MRSHTAPPPPSGRALAALAALAAVLIAAFVAVPPLLTGLTDERELTDRFRAAFAEYWSTGGRGFTPRLETLVESWFWYHVAKSATAALLLAVLVALAAALWRAFLHAGGRGAGRRAAVTSAGVTVTLLALAALAIVMANVQGAATPFASLLPMLVDGPTGGAADGRLVGILDETRQRLAGAPAADGATPPAVDALIDGFADYHAVMAVIATVVAVALAAVSVASWRRFARTPAPDRRARRAAGSFGALMTLAALAVAVVAVANTGTAADPVPALAALLDGGW